MEVEFIDILRYFLRTDTGFLFSPVKDRYRKADSYPRILCGVLINLIKTFIITDQTKRDGYISFKLIQCFCLDHVKTEFITLDFPLAKFQTRFQAVGDCLLQIDIDRLDLYLCKNHQVLIQTHSQSLFQLILGIFEGYLLFFDRRSGSCQVQLRLEQFIFGCQVSLYLILDDIIALLGIYQLFAGNSQLALRHIHIIELIRDIFFRIQPLQGITDMGILIIVFYLLQFHLPLVISEDRLGQLQIQIIIERLITILITVDIGVVILPAERIDQRDLSIRP